MIDTHTHIYLEEFNDDRNEVINRAINAGVEHIILPNVDFDTFDAMHELHEDYPQFTSMAMGLHPTSIDNYFQSLLSQTMQEIIKGDYIAVGEIGMDLYWDRTYEIEQRIALEQQLEVAAQQKLPVIIHCREAFKEILQVFDRCMFPLPQMVFHSFTGTAEQVETLRKYGDFYFGINGIVTFKNAKLDEMVRKVGIDRILLETDSPYLAPVPNRGKRNESAFVVNIANKIAEILGLSLAEVECATNKNAHTLFPLLPKF
ncbi:MAG: TatD family hydrolase [Muribaculaceae bacterium]|nr:TatD family hydrolase [Muribaculaceae bacterium]